MIPCVPIATTFGPPAAKRVQIFFRSVLNQLPAVAAAQWDLISEFLHPTLSMPPEFFRPPPMLERVPKNNPVQGWPNVRSPSYSPARQAIAAQVSPKREHEQPVPRHGWFAII